MSKLDLDNIYENIYIFKLFLKMLGNYLSVITEVVFIL